MSINELFIIEYPDGEIDDSHDCGGFTVFTRLREAEDALDCLEDISAKIVRFVREDAIDAAKEQPPQVPR